MEENTPTTPITPPSPVASDQEPRPTNPTKRKNILLTVGVIVIIILLVVIGIIVYRYVQLKNTAQPISLSTITPELRRSTSNNNGSDDFTENSYQVSENFKAVDTGQTGCFNNTQSIDCPSVGQDFFGQDAQYVSSVPKYIDNQDGTITDSVTGLMWQQDPGDKQMYYAAIAGVNSFTLAGHSDWRVPTIKELYSLIDFNGKDISAESSEADTPFIDDSVFDFEYGDTSAGDRIIDSQWVTSNVYESTVMGTQECFFGVNFADGRIKCYPTQSRNNKGYFAIYVRGVANYGSNNFSDNGDGSVTDNWSGLTWQQSDSSKGMNWADALAYCEDLSLANQTNWRLPNAKELQAIVDYSRSPDTTNSPAIDSIFETTSITNEGGEKDYPFFWSSTTHLSTSGGHSAVYVSFGRALGYMEQNGGWIDVHGAGAQRSDPKTGDPSDYPTGHGPQGDAVRIYNYVRCVSGGASSNTETDPADNSSWQSAPDGEQSPPDGGPQSGGPPPPRRNSR